ISSSVNPGGAALRTQRPMAGLGVSGPTRRSAVRISKGSSKPKVDRSVEWGQGKGSPRPWVLRYFPAPTPSEIKTANGSCNANAPPDRPFCAQNRLFGCFILDYSIRPCVNCEARQRTGSLIRLPPGQGHDRGGAVYPGRKSHDR